MVSFLRPTSLNISFNSSRISLTSAHDISNKYTRKKNKPKLFFKGTSHSQAFKKINS